MGLFKLSFNEINNDDLDDNYIMLSFNEEKKYNGDSLILNDIIAENTKSKLYNEYNIYSTIDNNKNNISYNGYEYLQNFKTIDYEKIYDNNDIIAYYVNTNTDNIFLSDLPFEIIKKYSILQTLPLIDNKIIGINEYQIFLFSKMDDTFNLLYIFYSNIFGNINYNRFLKLLTNYYSNTLNVNKILNIIEDNNILYHSYINIIDNTIELSTKQLNNIIAEDKNNNLIYIKNKTEEEEEYKLYRNNKLLLTKLLNPKLGYYDNDIFIVLGKYNNNNCLLFSNEVKDDNKTNYSIIHLLKNNQIKEPNIFIPINKDNMLKILYRTIENNESKYYYYIINNKFELLINNSEYKIIDGIIYFDKVNDNYIYSLFKIDNKIQIIKNNYIVFEFIYDNYEEYKKEIYYTIYGTVELIVKGDIATLKFKELIKSGTYEYNLITKTYIITISETEKYIVKINNKSIIINETSYIYYSNNTITYYNYSNNYYKLSYDIDLLNHINISCNKIIKEMYKSNVQSNILITTKDYLRYKVYNDINDNKKYVFKCKKE